MFTFGDLAETLRSGYPFVVITPRLIVFVLCSLLISNAGAAKSSGAKPPSSTTAGKVKRPKSWDKLVAYVLANGAERGIKAPLSKNLGYSEDEVLSRAFRYKQGTAPDGKEHAIHAVYKDEGGKKRLIEVALSNSTATTSADKKHIEGYMFRLKPDGTPISAVRISGDVGDIVQTPVSVADKSIATEIKSEKKIYTETMAGKDFE